MTHPFFTLEPQPELPFHAAKLYAAQALAASAGDWPGVVAHRNQRFGPASWQLFDVFTPAEPGSGRDVIVVFHGGGWTNGYREFNGLMAPGITAQGAILVAPTHRLAPGVRYPQFIHDAMTALAAIRRRIAAFGGDPDRLFLAGHSAGGHVATQIALRPDLRAPHDLPDSAFHGCLPISGILDLRSEAPAPDSLEARVYEMVLASPDQDAEASPLLWLDRLAMPLLLTWGLRDSERVRRSNAEAAERLTALGLPHRTRLEDTDHFGTHLALIDPAHGWYRDLARMREETR
ncbi:arylformamidase [Amorphus suaedae]